MEKFDSVHDLKAVEVVFTVPKDFQFQVNFSGPWTQQTAFSYNKDGGI